MTIDEAIEILDGLPDDLKLVLNFDQLTALCLGREALRLYHALKNKDKRLPGYSLPGETKD